MAFNEDLADLLLPGLRCSEQPPVASLRRRFVPVRFAVLTTIASSTVAGCASTTAWGQPSLRSDVTPCRPAALAAAPPPDALARPGNWGEAMFEELTHPLLNVRDELPPLAECWRIAAEGSEDRGDRRLCAQKVLQRWGGHLLQHDEHMAAAVTALAHKDRLAAADHLEAHCRVYEDDIRPDTPPPPPALDEAQALCREAVRVLRRDDPRASEETVMRCWHAHGQAARIWAVGVMTRMRDQFQHLFAAAEVGS